MARRRPAARRWRMIGCDMWYERLRRPAFSSVFLHREQRGGVVFSNVQNFHERVEPANPVVGTRRSL